MVKAAVIYDSKYGNTKIVAEKIAEGLNSTGDVEIEISYVKDFDPKRVGMFDIIVIGAPNHMGTATGKARRAAKRIARAGLGGKKVAAFDTCVKTEEGKAYGKLEELIREDAPDANLITPGLSILVGGMKGPIVDGEIPKCIEFGKRIGET